MKAAPSSLEPVAKSKLFSGIKITCLAITTGSEQRQSFTTHLFGQSSMGSFISEQSVVHLFEPGCEKN